MKLCRYIEKEKKMIRYITDDLEISFDDSDKEDSYKEDEKIIVLTMISFLGTDQFMY